MPVVAIDYRDLIKLIGKEISKEELIQKIPMIGADIERVEGNEMFIEFFPDRPDLLSVEGIARAIRSFLDIEIGMKKYKVGKSFVTIKVDPTTKKVRPFIAGAFIEGMEMDERTLFSLMDLQEKLHSSLGRDRKKMAIGLHDAGQIKAPLTYSATEPEKIGFTPLGMDEEMDLNEILERHEKGIKYAHLLDQFDRYPIITDARKNVLSFPPIINGELTAVGEETRNIFIEATGTDRKAVEGGLIIAATAIAERGGEIKSIKILDKKERFTPDLSPMKRTVKVGYANEILGSDMGKEEMLHAIKKMGHDAMINGEKLEVLVPRWRTDVLHPIDLVEDIAIGYGFENFEPLLSMEMTFGFSDYNQKIKDILIGLGFNEVMTLALSNEEEQFKKMGMKKQKMIQIENPITEKQSCMRRSLLPSLLGILKMNKHRDLPQKIFEVGEVVVGTKNRKRCCGVEIGAKVGFTKCKSIVEAIMKNLGIEAEIEEKEHPSFIEGRCASILATKEIGYFGEIHPRVIENFELEHPVIAFEFDMEKMK